MLTYCLSVEVETGQDDVDGHEHPNTKKEKGEIHSFCLIGWCFIFT